MYTDAFLIKPHGRLSVCGTTPHLGCHSGLDFEWTQRCSHRCTHEQSCNLLSHSWRQCSHCHQTLWQPDTQKNISYSYLLILVRNKQKNFAIYTFKESFVLQKVSKILQEIIEINIHRQGYIWITCLMSQLTFHCLMVLYLQVFTTSPTLRSIRIKRLLAMPRTSSLRQPLNLYLYGDK